MRLRGGGLPTTYKAVQFHLHWGEEQEPGSEHSVDGERYPMEVWMPYHNITLHHICKMETLTNISWLFCFTQLHIVHIKEQYSSLQEAENDMTGVAALAFFFEVLLPSVIFSL